jgi:cell division protein ZapD
MSTLYEHPLNERIRNYLKLEQLFSQASQCFECKINISHQVFFTALFAILDLLERTDVRGDLIKELEKLEQNMLLWSAAPDIDNRALNANMKLTLSLTAQLKSTTPSWHQLKNDKFLASLKQRFAIQGASSGFDLPQLKYWLNTSQQSQQSNIIQWLSQLEHISSSLTLVLKFIRQKAIFQDINSQSGFYQDSGDGVLLLRIKLTDDAGYYPTVSGNKLRYSIRFMLPCSENGSYYINQAVSFQLAAC